MLGKSPSKVGGTDIFVELTAKPVDPRDDRHRSSCMQMGRTAIRCAEQQQIQNRPKFGPIRVELDRIFGSGSLKPG
jgi:hypothetical protein